MIRASQAMTVSQGRDYYEKEFSKGDYYGKDAQEVVGTWSGKGAEALGLSGSIDKKDFNAVLEGKAKDGGRQLIPASVADGKHRAMWDFTASPDKTVSIMALVAGDDRIVKAAEAANAVAMKEVERFAMAKNKDRALESTGNLVIGTFKHETSRKHDPQLHFHNAIMNMTRRADGKFVALETREMFSAQKFFSYTFNSELVRELRKMGYDAQLSKQGIAVIDGIPKELVDTFSKRRAEIVEYAEAHGMQGARDFERATLKTRSAKERDIDRDELIENWKAVAKEMGVDLGKVRTAADRQVEAYSQDLDAPFRSLKYAVQHLSEREAVFKGRILEQTAMLHGKGDFTLAELRSVIQQAEGLVKVEDRLSPSGYFTTEAAIKWEAFNVQMMKAGRGAGPSIVGEKDPFIPSHFNADQREVARHILTTRDQVVAVEGLAGTGKTTALEGIAAAARAEGWVVRGFAPTTGATKGLSEVGIEAKTLAALGTERPGERSNGPGTALWVVDEAGMMSSKQMALVLDSAKQAGAKVVLIGDRQQHYGVEQGKPFTYLQDAGLKAVRLGQIVRQKDQGLLAAVNAAANGKAAESVSLLETQGRVREIASASARHQEMAREYLATPEGKTCLLLAPSNEERRQLNDLVRKELIKGGQVQREGYSSEVRVSKGLTAAQRGEAANYEIGDHLKFRTASRVFGIERGSEGRVIGVKEAEGKVEVAFSGGTVVEFEPRRFRGAEVSRVEARQFSVGDSIQYREPTKADGVAVFSDKTRIANGDTGRIKELDSANGKALVLMDGSKKLIHVNLSAILPVDHAYAVTSHSSQGRTVDRALVSVDTNHSASLVNQSQFYVCISRARDEALVFTNNREGLAQAVSRDAGKTSALELLQSRSTPTPSKEVSHGAFEPGRGARTQRSLSAQSRGRSLNPGGGDRRAEAAAHAGSYPRSRVITGGPKSQERGPGSGKSRSGASASADRATQRLEHRHGRARALARAGRGAGGKEVGSVQELFRSVLEGDKGAGRLVPAANREHGVVSQRGLGEGRGRAAELRGGAAEVHGSRPEHERIRDQVRRPDAGISPVLPGGIDQDRRGPGLKAGNASPAHEVGHRPHELDFGGPRPSVGGRHPGADPQVTRSAELRAMDLEDRIKELQKKPAGAGGLRERQSVSEELKALKVELYEARQDSRPDIDQAKIQALREERSALESRMEKAASLEDRVVLAHKRDQIQTEIYTERHGERSSLGNLSRVLGPDEYRLHEAVKGIEKAAKEYPQAGLNQPLTRDAMLHMHPQQAQAVLQDMGTALNGVRAYADATERLKQGDMGAVVEREVTSAAKGAIAAASNALSAVLKAVEAAQRIADLSRDR